MDKNTTLKDLLAKYSEMVDFKAGEKLFDYEEKADKIYFILSGLIRVFIKDKNETKEIKRNKNGDFVGETAFIAAKYSSQAKVHLDSTVLKFKVADLRKIMENNNEFANKMINNLANYIEILQSKDQIQLTPIAEIDKKIANEKEIKKNIETKKSKKSYVKKAASEIKKSNFFYLEGHSTYHQKAKANDQYYLYDKEIECPVCSTELAIKKLRNSRLRVDDIRADLRPIYKDFNLYYYSVISCTNCLFTARRKDFFDFSKRKRKKIKNNFKKIITKELNSKFKVNYSQPRSINEAFDAHYLALKLYNYLDLDNDKRAFLWRELSWMYEDLEEEDLANKASLAALENLEEFYFQDDSSTSKKESNNLSLLLAVLYYKHGQANNALPLLDDLIRDSRVHLRQKNKARELFQKIREEQKQK